MKKQQPMEKNNNLPAGVTDEMVKAWKERYGENNIKVAQLPKNDDGSENLDVIVRVPDRKTLGEFEKWVDKAPDKAKEILINACVLTHKDEVKADDGLFMAAFDALSKILPYRSATIKNL